MIPKPVSLLPVTLCLALALRVLGQTPPPPPPPPPLPVWGNAPAPKAEAAKPVVIPEDLTPAARDPFWPVGYTPSTARREAVTEAGPAPVAVVEDVFEPRWKEARASLKIGGSLKTPNGYTAVINNTLVNAGDVVSLVYENHRYRWKVESITLNGIAFVPIDCVGIDAPTRKGTP